MFVLWVFGGLGGYYYHEKADHRLESSAIDQQQRCIVGRDQDVLLDGINRALRPSSKTLVDDGASGMI